MNESSRSSPNDKRTESFLSRRDMLSKSAYGLGSAALGSIMGTTPLFAQNGKVDQDSVPFPNHRPSAKRVIMLFMGGGPSQIDLFDHKPAIAKMAGDELPESIRKGQRLTTMTSGQGKLPIAPSIFRFARHGQCGAWVSELMPNFANVVDEVTFIRSVSTDSINHDPGMTFFQTGHEQPGRPSIGSWVAYGLGNETENLPTYVVLHSKWSGSLSPQPIFARLWGSGFLPSRFQGVSLRSNGDPVLYLTDPPGVGRGTRRSMLRGLEKLNRIRYAKSGDKEIETRIAQYELAAKMQTSVPELTDFGRESQVAKKLYGPDCERPGTFAANCLLARRMAERGVRFVQIYHRGWDQHGNLPSDLRKQCGDVDRACAGLILDLKQNGLLDDTLVVWASEFGRTVYSQGALTETNYGRDHHPRCFTVWMAGGGVRPGLTYGSTDEFGYNVIGNPVHVHDLNATILHCLGINHKKLTYRHQGREFRLTDVHGNVVADLLS